MAATAIPQNISNNSAGVNVQKYEKTGDNVILPYSRRDYYKIWIVKEESALHYADKSIHIDRPALIFSNPLVPYSFESFSATRSGYMCIFTEAFIREHAQESIQQSPVFRIGSHPVFFLDQQQLDHLSALYEKMLVEIASDYIYKYDVLRSYVNLLIHEALKMQPAHTAFQYHNATSRIAALFIELLERQFPIDSPHHTLTLRKPADYAHNLSVHVNHLNHAVREITGKTTTVHITARIVNEAKALLKNTDWSVADIASCLGFEYATYFNNFFKKNTGATPLSFRK
jgi:AraC family transcriptional regulator, transcriptional activator of pobA